MTDCEKFLYANDYVGAINCYRQKLNQSPDDPDLINGLGISLTLSGQFEQAVTMFDRALAIDPRLTSCHYNKANCLLQIGQDTRQPQLFRQALHHFEAIADLERSNAVYFYNRGCTKKLLFDYFQDEKMLIDAIPDFKKAISLDSGELPYHIAVIGGFEALGRHRNDLEDLVSALMAYDHALEEFPTAADIIVDKGALHAEIGMATGEVKHHTLAIECFTEALALAPEEDFLYRNIGSSNWRVFNGNNDIAYARETAYWFGQYLNRNQQDPVSFQIYGDALAEIGEHDDDVSLLEDAILVFDQVLALCPGYINASNSRGLAYSKMADMLNDESLLLASIGFFEQAIAENPSVSTFHYHKGLTEMKLFTNHSRSAYIERAIVSYQAALGLDPAQKQFRRALAYGFLQLSRFEVDNLYQALYTYKDALAKDGENSLTYIGLAETLHYLGKANHEASMVEQAINFFDQAISLDGQNEMAYYKLAKANQTMAIRFGQYDHVNLAITNFDLAIGLNPDQDGFKNRKGIFLRKAGKRYKVRTYFEAAIEIFAALGRLPGNEALYNNNTALVLADIAEAFLEEDKIHEAIIHYKKVQASGTKDGAMFTFNLAQAYAILGKNWAGLAELEQALVLYQKSIGLKDDYANAYYYRGLAYEFIVEKYGQPKKAEALENYFRAFFLDQGSIDSAYDLFLFVMDNFNAPQFLNRMLSLYPELLFIPRKGEEIKECLERARTDRNRLVALLEGLGEATPPATRSAASKLYGAITAYLGGDPIKSFDLLDYPQGDRPDFRHHYFLTLSARDTLHPESEKILSQALESARKRIDEGKLNAGEVYYISSLFMLNGELSPAVQGFGMLKGQSKYFASSFKLLECLLRLGEQDKAKQLVEALHLSGQVDSFAKKGFSGSPVHELEFMVQEFESAQGWYLSARLMDEQDEKLRSEKIPLSRSIFNWASSVKAEWPEPTLSQLNQLNQEYIDALKVSLPLRMGDIFALYQAKTVLEPNWAAENLYSHMFNEHRETGAVIFGDYADLLFYAYAQGKLGVNDYLLISAFLNLKNVLLNKGVKNTLMKITAGGMLMQVLQPLLEGLGATLTGIPVKPLIKLIFDNKEEETIKLMNFQVFQNHFKEMQKLSKSEISAAIELMDNDFLGIATDYLEGMDNGF